MRIIRTYWVVTRYPVGQDLADASYELSGVTGDQVRRWLAVPDDVSMSDVWMIGEDRMPYMQDLISDRIDLEKYMYEVCEYADYDWKRGDKP